jgi:hypothetical protein
MYLDVGIVLVGQRQIGGLRHLLLVLLENGLVDLNFRWSESRSGNEFLGFGLAYYMPILRRKSYQSLITNEFSGEPKERLLEVVV